MKKLFKRVVHKVICFKQFKDNPAFDLETKKIMYAKVWYVFGVNIKSSYITTEELL